MKMPAGGGIATTLASGQAAPRYGIAVDAANVYWINYEGTGGGSVVQLPLIGGTATTLATGQTDTGSLALNCPLVPGACTATSVYWTGYYGVMTVPIGGGTTTAISSVQSAGGGIATDATNVYWTSPGDTNGAGAIYQMPLGGGSPTPLGVGQNYPYNVAVDSTSVYWATLGTSANSFKDGTVMKATIGGGAVTILASGLSAWGAWGVAVDATNVYWTCYEGGTVMTV